MYLAPATASIVPVSSKQNLGQQNVQNQPPNQQFQQLHAPVQLQPPLQQTPLQHPLIQQPAVASQQGQSQDQGDKRIAMQWLSATPQQQTQMLRDPHVARAILSLVPQQAAPKLQAPPARPPVPGALMVPAAGHTPITSVNGQPPAWAGGIILTRSMGKHLRAHATLVFGKVTAVEVALRAAAGSGGVLNISHRVPFDDLARRTPSAVLVLVPQGPQDQSQYDEYSQYFRAKARAGVAKLDDADALYVVPPCADAAALLSSLKDHGASALPSNALVAVIAASPGATTGAAAQNAVSAPTAPQADTLPQSATPAPLASTQPAGTVADASRPSESVVGPADAPVVDADRSSGAADASGDGDDNQEMSREALLDLFSNPELIRSLQQGTDETPAS